MSQNGTLLWTDVFAQASAAAASQGNRLAVNLVTQMVFITGQSYGSVEATANRGFLDCFVGGYSTNGTRMWTRQDGTADYDAGFAAVAYDQGVLIAGVYHNNGYAEYFHANGTSIWSYLTQETEVHFSQLQIHKGWLYAMGQISGTMDGVISQ